MARRLDLNQLRKAKNNQFKPNERLTEVEPAKVVPEKKVVKQPVTTPKTKTKSVASRKSGRPVDEEKKPTRATSIRVHPDLVEVPKILAGISRKNVYSIYNEMIVEMLVKYKKKYPQLLDDLNIPPRSEL